LEAADNLDGNYKSLLVEVIDARTGETLGIADNKFPNRILQLSYDDDPRRVRLWGTKSVVDIDFAGAGLAGSGDVTGGGASASALTSRYESARRESNPRSQLGKLP
jgi:hypothetical protein